MKARLKKSLLLSLLGTLSVPSTGIGAQLTGITREYDSHVSGHASITSMTYDRTSVSGLGIHGSIGTFLFRSLSAEAGYFSMNDATGKTLVNGFDFTLQWYLFSPGSAITITGEDKRFVAYSEWTHYVIFGSRLRDLALEETTTSFSGVGYGYGLRWFIGSYFDLLLVDKTFLSMELTRNSLTSAEGVDLATNHAALGLGMSL